MKLKKGLKNLFGFHIPSSTVGKNNEANRVDWIKSTLEKLPSGLKILDAGAGERPYEKFCRHLDYVAHDFAGYDPNATNTGLQVKNWEYGELDIISDIASIPVPSDSFDAILCTEVLEHVINPREALNEFSRVLRKGGYLIVSTPFCSLTHFAPYHFYTGFSRYFYEKELQEDYYDIKIKSNGNYFEYLAQEVNRLPFVSKKHTGIQLSKSDKKKLTSLNELLDNMSQKDSGSDELLCFGYFILARRR